MTVSGRQPTDRELWAAYSQFTASARTVYWCCVHRTEYLSEIRGALDKCQDPHALFPLADGGWDDSVSNVLVIVGQATLDGKIYRGIMHGKVATPFIWDMIHQHAQRLLGSSMRQIYNNLLSDRISRGTAGSIFEDTAYHVLSAVGTQSYAVRSLPSGHNSSSQMQWDLSITSQAVIFEKICQISGNLVPRTYYRPLNSNIPSINSFTFVDGTPILFRFTTSLDHSIEVQGLQSVANILPTKSRYRKKWKLVFVVPTDIEPEFKYQLYEPSSYRETWEKRVDQYVMGLSAEQLFPTA
ncbi:hypothetical protein BKA93DRAFT_406727 [Sparassis latifolia]